MQLRKTIKKSFLKFVSYVFFSPEVHRDDLFRGNAKDALHFSVRSIVDEGADVCHCCWLAGRVGCFVWGGGGKKERGKRGLIQEVIRRIRKSNEERKEGGNTITSFSTQVECKQY